MYKFDREWLESLYYSTMEKRLEKQLDRKQTKLEFKDEINALYKQVMVMSSKVLFCLLQKIIIDEKGRGTSLLSLSLKKRRTKQELLKDSKQKEAEKQLIADSQAMKRKIEELEYKLENANKKMKKTQEPEEVKEGQQKMEIIKLNK